MSTSIDSELNISDQQSLDCNVSVVPFLVVEPTLQWVAPGGVTIASTTGRFLSHAVNIERTSAAGRYMCQAMVDVATIGLTATGKGYTSIFVQSKFQSKQQYICSPILQNSF